MNPPPLVVRNIIPKLDKNYMRNYKKIINDNSTFSIIVGIYNKNSIYFGCIKNSIIYSSMQCLEGLKFKSKEIFGQNKTIEEAVQKIFNIFRNENYEIKVTSSGIKLSLELIKLGKKFIFELDLLFEEEINYVDLINEKEHLTNENTKLLEFPERIDEKLNSLKSNNKFNNILKDPEIKSIFTDLENEILNEKSIEIKYRLNRKYGEIKEEGKPFLEGWKEFYEKNDSFFTWRKGTIIRNQIIIKNENNDEEIILYEGEINDKRKRHGIGKEITKDYVREGTWREDQFTGWNKETRRSGDVFVGKFINGDLEGKGINYFRSKIQYVGDFKNNKFDGSGKYTSKYFEYEGDFVKGKMEGKGKIIFHQNHKYEGQFQDNKINGVGTFTWSNGDVYQGRLIDGIMDGYGTYKSKEKNELYEGEFELGKRNGDGKLVKSNGDIYMGNFSKGELDGECTALIKAEQGFAISTLYYNHGMLINQIKGETTRKGKGFPEK